MKEKEGKICDLKRKSVLSDTRKIISKIPVLVVAA